MYRAPHKCVICRHKLTITQLTCESCGTRIEGRFDGCRFCSLSPEEARFLLTFIRNRGSIKDVERELGVSYPTVRAMLDNLISALDRSESTEGGEAVPAPAVQDSPPPQESEASGSDRRRAQKRKDILNRLAAHEISAEEAAAALKKL